MANCPKCGYKLKFTDIKAECPNCGVNLVYFNQRERLAEDADKAEEEHIRMQPKIDRIKFSFIGTKLAIVRLILLFVPIGMLFLPLAHIKVDIPFHSIDTNISIINVIMDGISKLDFSLLAAIPTVAMVCYIISLVSVILALVFAFLNIPLDSLSSSPHGFQRNIALSSCGIGFSLLGIITFSIFNSQLTKNFGAIYSGKLSFGGFLVIVAFLAIILINVIIKKKNVPVKYKDISEYVDRIERRKKEIAEMEAKTEQLRKEYLKAEKEKASI